MRIRERLGELEQRQARLDDMRLTLGPRGQSFDQCGHGSGNGDASGATLVLVQVETELERDRAKVNAEVSTALHVLYGKGGRGGLAKAKSTASADCICGYYLQLMTWREVSDELVKPDSKDGPQWCRRRAHRGLEYIDRHGANRLIYG